MICAVCTGIQTCALPLLPRRADRLLRRWCRRRGFLGLHGGDLGVLAGAPEVEGAVAGDPGDPEEREHRDAGQQRHDDHQAGTHRQRLRIAAELAEHGLVGRALDAALGHQHRSEEHTSELQSLMRISYAVFCLKKKTINKNTYITTSLNTY